MRIAVILLIVAIKNVRQKQHNGGRANFVLPFKKAQSIMAEKGWQKGCVTVHIWEEQEAKK